MDITRRLAQFAADTKFEDIPKAAVEVEKQSILDNIGIISGGADGDGCREFVEYAKAAAEGGKAEASVLGFGFKLPAIWAAFANASMTMSLDFADTSATATIHPNTSTFTASLAVAQKEGIDINGKEFITAMCVGSEVACRLARAAVSSRFVPYGFYMPPVFTAFGATTAVCKLLGLNADQMIDAWSITLSSYTCSSELTQNKGTSIRSIREAFGAQAAISAAFLAQKGIKGYTDPFEGKLGFYHMYFDDDYNPELVLKDLGSDWECAKLIFKPWPCCMGNHGCINAALNIKAKNSFKNEDIKSIHAEVPSVAKAVCEPLADKRAPKNAINAKYSIPFTVATALIEGNVVLDSFNEDRFGREDILALAAKTDYELNDAWDKDVELKTGGKLTITLNDGTEYSEWVKKTLGNPENPMSPEQFKSKFVSCMAQADKAAAAETVEKIFRMVMSLEDLENMKTLGEML